MSYFIKTGRRKVTVTHHFLRYFTFISSVRWDEHGAALMELAQ